MSLRRYTLGAFVGALAMAGVWLLVPAAARADAPGLQINPLQYEDSFKTQTVRRGFIDVANPGDATVTVASNVRGFRQVDQAGRLSFYDDADLAAAIKVELGQFQLGPHEAIRVAFSVDPKRLPGGGVYAAIFFRTQPADQTSQSSYVAESVNVGTLLELTNGDGRKQGEVTRLDLPWLQLGDGLTGTVAVHNTAPEHGGLGFRPELTSRVGPWGRPQPLTSGLILPGNTRRFALQRAGAYLGPLPITVADAATGAHRTTWILACTGYYRWAVPLGLVGLLVLAWLWRRRRRRLRRAATPSLKQPMDGLSRRPEADFKSESESKPGPEPEPAPEAGEDA